MHFSGYVRLTEINERQLANLTSAGVPVIRGPRGSLFVPSPSAALLSEVREQKKALVESMVLKLQADAPHERSDPGAFTRELDGYLAALANRHGVPLQVVEDL